MRSVRFPSAFQVASLLTTDIAQDNDFDVVLIDTAGRMQDNEVSRRCVVNTEVLMHICSFSTAVDARARKGIAHTHRERVLRA